MIEHMLARAFPPGTHAYPPGARASDRSPEEAGAAIGSLRAYLVDLRRRHVLDGKIVGELLGEDIAAAKLGHLGCFRRREAAHLGRLEPPEWDKMRATGTTVAMTSCPATRRARGLFVFLFTWTQQRGITKVRMRAAHIPSILKNPLNVRADVEPLPMDASGPRPAMVLAFSTRASTLATLTEIFISPCGDSLSGSSNSGCSSVCP